jgi:hypothetical protein
MAPGLIEIFLLLLVLLFGFVLFVIVFPLVLEIASHVRILSSFG